MRHREDKTIPLSMGSMKRLNQALCYFFMCNHLIQTTFSFKFMFDNPLWKHWTFCFSWQDEYSSEISYSFSLALAQAVGTHLLILLISFSQSIVFTLLAQKTYMYMLSRLSIKLYFFFLSCGWYTCPGGFLLCFIVPICIMHSSKIIRQVMLIPEN